jgi:hypothetical protein
VLRQSQPTRPARPPRAPPAAARKQQPGCSCHRLRARPRPLGRGGPACPAAGCARCAPRSSGAAPGSRSPSPTGPQGGRGACPATPPRPAGRPAAPCRPPPRRPRPPCRSLGGRRAWTACSGAATRGGSAARVCGCQSFAATWSGPSCCEHARRPAAVPPPPPGRATPLVFTPTNWRRCLGRRAGRRTSRRRRTDQAESPPNARAPERARARAMSGHDDGECECPLASKHCKIATVRRDLWFQAVRHQDRAAMLRMAHTAGRGMVTRYARMRACTRARRLTPTRARTHTHTHSARTVPSKSATPAPARALIRSRS